MLPTTVSFKYQTEESGHLVVSGSADSRLYEATQEVRLEEKKSQATGIVLRNH